MATRRHDESSRALRSRLTSTTSGMTRSSRRPANARKKSLLSWFRYRRGKRIVMCTPEAPRGGRSRVKPAKAWRGFWRGFGERTSGLVTKCATPLRYTRSSSLFHQGTPRRPDHSRIRMAGNGASLRRTDLDLVPQ
jgi:hypothetical protein